MPTAADFYDLDNSTNGRANSPTQLAYDTLLSFKQGPGVAYAQLATQAKLAEHWEVASDATAYSFRLRKGVRFANLSPVNGRELTSADVKWSYEYYSRTGAVSDKKLKPSLFSYMFEGLDRIETPDAQTVIVRFKDPFGPFLNYASTPVLPIVPHEIFDADGSFSNRMLGTGPFQLDPAASQHGTQWILKKQTNYWESGKPYLDVEIMANSAGQSKIAQLVQGQLKRAGVNLVIKPVDSATYGQKLHGGDFTASVAQAFLYADLDSRLYGAFYSGSGSNYAGISDARLDGMIEAQRREADAGKRQQLIKEASRYLAENAYETMLYQQTLATFWHPYVRNYADNWMQLNWNAPAVWLEK